MRAAWTAGGRGRQGQGNGGAGEEKELRGKAEMGMLESANVVWRSWNRIVWGGYSAFLLFFFCLLFSRFDWFVSFGQGGCRSRGAGSSLCSLLAAPGRLCFIYQKGGCSELNLTVCLCLEGRSDMQNVDARGKLAESRIPFLGKLYRPGPHLPAPSSALSTLYARTNCSTPRSSLWQR